MSTTKTVSAILLVLGSVSLAQASGFDPNLANRYPAYAEAGVYGYSAAGGAPQRLQPHTLVTRDVALTHESAPQIMVAGWMDRASQSFSGGGY